jgi:hypothetical protein
MQFLYLNDCKLAPCHWRTGCVALHAPASFCVLPATQTNQNIPFVSVGCVGLQYWNAKLDTNSAVGDSDFRVEVKELNFMTDSIQKIGLCLGKRTGETDAIF